MSWLIFFLSFLGHAAPAELEVWFLTPPTTQGREDFLRPTLLRGVLLAQACEPIGDFCFDPQIGLYQKETAPQKEMEFEVDQGLPQLPTARSVDRSLVSCDEKYAFDIFCGKARPEEKSVPTPSGFEVWVDVSSSMRGIDGGDGKGSCQRAVFLQQLLASCEKARPTIKGFDTSLREMGPEGACTNQGLNDAKRMIQWMEESQAKKLLVITDVYELQMELSRFLESKRARIRGDVGAFSAAHMLDHVSELAKACSAP